MTQPAKPLAIKGAWGLLASLIAGVIAPVAFSPHFIWPLGVISLVILITCLREVRPWQGFWRGWCYGLGLFGSGASWVYISINTYGNASPALAALLTFLFVSVLALFFTAIFGYCFARWIKGNNAHQLIGFVALWVLFEWSRSWLFTGFPWLLAGYAHTNTLLNHWAPIGGVYLLSFIVALTAALLYWLIELVRRRDYRYASYCGVVLCMPWLAGTIFSLVEWTAETGDPITVELFQPNVTQDVKWLPEQRSKTLAALQRNLLHAPSNSLLVWPENAIPAFYHQAKSYTDSLAAQARNKNIGIISGIPYQRSNADGDRVFHNSIVGLGLAEGAYHKQKLVPFGEYVPLQQWLRGVIDFFDLPMSNFRKGPSNQSHPSFTRGDRTLKIAPYICYEVVYPDFARKLGHNSDLMLTISDDSWFGESIGPFQHLQMARMRALENGRYLVRGTNTGVTAIISPSGDLVELAPQFERTSLRGEVRQTTGTTPFGRIGSWPTLLLCTFLLLWSIRNRSVRAN